MAIDPSTSAFSPMNLQQLSQMEQVTEAAVEEMARAELEINDSLTIAEGEAERINTEPNSPRLPGPDPKLLGKGQTPDKQIAMLLKLSNEELGDLFKTLPGTKALLNAGVDLKTIAENFKSVLKNNTGSQYSAEHLANRALGELMEKQLAKNPTPELKQAWFTLRSKMLSNVSPQAKILINLIKQQLIAKGMSPEEAQKLAEKMVVTSVDGELSENGVVTPFYGMHPEMSGAVNAVLAEKIDKIGNITPKEFAIFLEDLGTAAEIIVRNLGNAKAVEDSGKPGKTTKVAIEELKVYMNVGDSLMGEINELLEGLPDFPGKTALLAMMKLISELIADFQKDLKEIEEMDAKQKKTDTKNRITAAKDRTTNILKMLADAQKKIDEAREKADKMKSSMGFLSVLSDVIMGIMLAIMGPLLILMSGIFLAAIVGILGTTTVFIVMGAILNIGIPIISMLVVIALLVLALILAPTGVGPLIALILGVIIEIILAAVQIMFNLIALLVLVVMIVVWVVIFLAWLVVFMITAIIVASLAITKSDNVTDAMVDAVGPAMMEMLKKIGIDIDDMDIIYMIITVLPIVLVVLLIALPLLLLLILPLVMGVVITVATVLVPIIAVIVLVVILALAIVLSLVWGPILGVLNALIAIAMYTGLAIILTVIIVILVPLIALIVAIILALVILVLAGVIAALLPAILLLMLQWLPMFFAKSGLLGKMASGIGGAFGMSEEETEELEMILYGINAGLTAASGMQLQESHYSQGAQGEVDERESGFDEGENAYQMDKLEKKIKKLEEFITRFGGRSGLSAEELGRKKGKEDELVDRGDAIQKLIKFMRKILEILRKAFSGVKSAGGMPTAGQQGDVAKAVLGDLTGQSMNLIAETMGQFMDPETVQGMIPNEKSFAHGGHGLINSLTDMMEEGLPTSEFLKPYIDADNERYYNDEEDDDEYKKQLASVSQIFG